MGECKITNGRVNNMRRIGRQSEAEKKKSKKKKSKSRKHLPKLDSSDQQALDRAYKHGFVTVNRQVTSSLRKAHADICRKLRAPQIAHCKATTRHSGASVQMDTVWIDLSTISENADIATYRWQAQSTAESTGIEISVPSENDSRDRIQFEGDRSMCKAFCRQLAQQWSLPQEGERKERRRERQGGHRQRQY